MSTDSGWSPSVPNIMTTHLRLMDNTRVEVRDDGLGNVEFVARQSEENGVTEHALCFGATINEVRSLASILNRTAEAISDHTDYERSVARLARADAAGTPVRGLSA